MGINEFFYILARYTGYFAISLISVSIVSVLASLQPLFVLVYGILLSFYFPKILKEQVSPEIMVQKVAAIVLLTLGLILLT